MKYLKHLLIPALIVLFAQVFLGQQRMVGKVVDVTNGKTVVIELSDGKKITAELEYVEIPEPEQPFSQVIKEHLKNLALGKNVELVAKVILPKHVIGKVFLGDVNLSQQLLRDGAAWYAVLEKERQETFERQNYQLVESQAKLEKRGIWGIADLKPAWVFRAEKEAARKESEAGNGSPTTLTTRYTASSSGKRRYLTPEEQNQAGANVGMWASAVGINETKYLGIDGLYTGSIPKERVTYIYTGGSPVDLTQKASEHQVEFRAFYGYRGDQSKIELIIFGIGFASEAKEYKFARSNALTILADGKQIYAGKAIRFQQKDVVGAQELMLYRISRNTLEKLVHAGSIKIKLGLFAGEIKRDSRVLLDKLLKTTN
jgi:endonuclease YncB( thermonuclease family)